jgi:hypothetical protein
MVEPGVEGGVGCDTVGAVEDDGFDVGAELGGDELSGTLEGGATVEAGIDDVDGVVVEVGGVDVDVDVVPSQFSGRVAVPWSKISLPVRSHDQ